MPVGRLSASRRAIPSRGEPLPETLPQPGQNESGTGRWIHCGLMAATFRREEWICGQESLHARRGSMTLEELHMHGEIFFGVLAQLRDQTSTLAQGLIRMLI